MTLDIKSTRLQIRSMTKPIKPIPYDDWRAAAGREIMDTIHSHDRLKAYYASGQGDGWARSYGAPGNIYPDQVTAIIDKHYKASLSKTA